MRRLGLALLCVLLLLSWTNRQIRPGEPSQAHFHPLDAAAGAVLAPGLSVEGLWQVTGSGEAFGGYSALAGDRTGRFIALGDGGGRLDFADPSKGDPRPHASWLFDGPDIIKARRDVEALAADPATGRLWAAYEFRNAIARFAPDGAMDKRVRPPAMKDWSANSGPEAMARLDDGRFVVLAEMQLEPPGKGCPGLLFASDPVEGAKPVQFRFVPPAGFAASDMAALPDGRVLILVRRLDWPFPPRFAAQLLLADPAMIVPGKPWPWRLLAPVASPVPLDNYEGLAVVPGDDGALGLWLISDDNAMATQRSLLLKLRWDWKAQTQKSAQVSPRALSTL